MPDGRGNVAAPFRQRHDVEMVGAQRPVARELQHLHAAAAQALQGEAADQLAPPLAVVGSAAGFVAVEYQHAELLAAADLVDPPRKQER